MSKVVSYDGPTINIRQDNNSYLLTFYTNKNFFFSKKKKKIGHIEYSICSDANTNNINLVNENQRNILTNVKNKIINTMKNKRYTSIHINFIRVEENYKGKGISYMILNEFINNLEKCNITKYYITLTDDTDRIDNNKSFWEKFGAILYTSDDEAIIIDIPKFKKHIRFNLEKYRKININKSNNTCPSPVCKKRRIQEGGIQYIITSKGKRKIHTGKRGGKYYLLNKSRIYIK